MGLDIGLDMAEHLHTVTPVGGHTGAVHNQAVTGMVNVTVGSGVQRLVVKCFNDHLLMGTQEHSVIPGTTIAFPYAFDDRESGAVDSFSIWLGTKGSVTEDEEEIPTTVHYSVAFAQIKGH
jgi:hypothetical protein